MCSWALPVSYIGNKSTGQSFSRPVHACECLKSLPLSTQTNNTSQATADLRAAASGIWDSWSGYHSRSLQLRAGYLSGAGRLTALMSKWWGFRSEMVIHPLLLMRSQEDQPCVERCLWTSPPLFLQSYCSSVLVPMLPTARVRQDFYLHSTTLLFLVCHHPSAWYPSCPDLCSFASSQFLHHSFTPTLMRYPAHTEKRGIFSSFHSLHLIFRT